MLRSEVVGSQHKYGTPGWYYAKRVRARSARALEQFNVPAVIGQPRRPWRDEHLNMRLDVLGPLIREHYPVVPDSSRRNLLASFDKRCNYFSNSRVHPSVIKGSLALLDRTVGTGCDPIEWTPELFNRWNAQFKPSKQAKHLKVYPLLAECTSRQFSSKEIFVKVEALMKRHDVDWAPRVIYQSSDLHNCLLGPIMQACTYRMFRLFRGEQHVDSVNYMGAYKVQTHDMSGFINRAGTDDSVYIETDFSSNDMTQLRDVHMLEVLWLRRLGAPEWLTALMLHANSFVVTNRANRVMAKITNQLPTGAQSTTFRNTMWNSSISYTFCTRYGFRGDSLVLGDDNLFRCDNPWASRSQKLKRAYEHVCQQAGMRGTVSVHKHLSEASFLSKVFIMTDNGYVMVPKFGKAIARFNARASANEAVSDRSYLAGKALSYAYEFRHCPYFSRCYYERFIQLAPDGVVSLDGIGWNAKGAFLDLGIGGIQANIFNPIGVCTRDDVTRFYHWKYSKTFSDIMEVLLASLFGEQDLDEALVGRVLEDFLG